MDIRPEIQIQAMIKSMVEVVIPAIDPAHKLAQEQANLVSASLQLIARRLSIAFRYDVDELERYLAFTQSLLQDAGHAVPADTAETLRSTRQAARSVLDGARSAPAEVEQSSLALRNLAAQFVAQACRSGNDEQKSRVRRLTLDHSRDEVLRERALVVAMGFEVDSQVLPGIDQLLAASASPQSR